MITEPLALPEVLLIKPRVFRDDRGWFSESWRENDYASAGLPRGFVQDNVSVSHVGTLRGLHYQQPRAQGKLVSTLVGRIFDAAVDIRRGSPTFGRWIAQELSSENGHQLWIPAGFAHGFVVLSDEAVVVYKCTVYYAPECERSIRWNDPAIGIAWPVSDPLLSDRDAAAPLLADRPPDTLPVYGATNA